MNAFQGIVVQVISNGQVLDLYNDPDPADTDDGRTQLHYVEAVTGAKFAVRVMLTTEFHFYDLRPCDGVDVSLSIGGQINGCGV